MIAAALKRILSLGAERKARSTEADVPQVFSSAAERIRVTGQYTLDDIDLLTQTMSQYDIVYGSPWDDFRQANLVLPSWFKFGLPAESDEYAAQQHRLWALLTRQDRPYAPELDERAVPLTGVDAVRRPAYYMRRDVETVRLAADQIVAMGMILKHCGLKPGDRALEYGAGFGQPSLALARLGIVVDTVDISRTYCDFVREQAEFFQVPLTPFEGRFGWNPRGDQKYDLILFFEAFHHCADFRSVVRELRNHLAPGGRVLLVGEPIARSQNRYLPYPWGLRLDAEPIVQVRRYGWLELGFTEEFLVGLFTDAGFVAEPVECPPSVCANGYVFTLRGSRIELKDRRFCDNLEPGWNNPEDIGRWTKAEARLFLDTSDTFQKLEIDASNRLPFPKHVEFRYGDWSTVVRFKMSERKSIVIDATKKARQIEIRTKAHVPARYPFLGSRDTRSLGILVRSLTYS